MLSMNHKVINLDGKDCEVVDDLERLGYLPVSLRTKIQNRIYRMSAEWYTRATQLFQRFDVDPVGNSTPSPISYNHERLYEPS